MLCLRISQGKWGAQRSRPAYLGPIVEDSSSSDIPGDLWPLGAACCAVIAGLSEYLSSGLLLSSPTYFSSLSLPSVCSIFCCYCMLLPSSEVFDLHFSILWEVAEPAVRKAGRVRLPTSWCWRHWLWDLLKLFHTLVYSHIRGGW